MIHHLFLLTATIHGSRHKRSEVLTYPPTSQRELLLHYTRSTGRPTRGQSRKHAHSQVFFFFFFWKCFFLFTTFPQIRFFFFYSKLVLKLIIFYFIKPDCCCHAFCKSLMINTRVYIFHKGIFMYLFCVE